MVALGSSEEKLNRVLQDLGRALQEMYGDQAEWEKGDRTDGASAWAKEHWLKQKRLAKGRRDESTESNRHN